MTAQLLSISASRADLRRAALTFKRAERSALSAERRTLGRAASTVRNMEIAAVQGRKNKAGATVAPVNRQWRQYLHPEKKLGAFFKSRDLWHIWERGTHRREVDVKNDVQPLFARWQFPDGSRERQLRALVTFWQGAGRRNYHINARRLGMPETPQALPQVPPMPRRDIKTPVESYAGANMGKWYLGIFETMQRRG